MLDKAAVVDEASGEEELAVNVKADFAAETSDGGSVNVPLSATFVQEVVIQPGVRGSIVTKKILFIPVPIGVQVNSTVDIKSYSAFSFNAQIYTVEPEEKSTWEKIKDLINDDKLVEGLKGADKIANGLKTVGSLGDNAVVDNCVSYAVVEGIGIDTGSHTRVSYGVIVNSWFRDFLK